MRIAFIWPHANTIYQTIPLALGVLHTNIKHLGHTTKLFSLPLEGWRSDSPEYHRAIAEFKPDLIAASAWAMSWKSTVSAVKAAKAAAPEAIAALGGNYATLNPEQAWEAGCFDYILTGECELVFPEFLTRLAAKDTQGLKALPGMYLHDGNGQIISNKNAFVEDLDQLGPVDYEFIQLERYFSRGYMRTLLGPRRKMSMLATRGCEHSCQFCTAPIMNGQDLRHYSTGFLCEQIRLLYDKYKVRRVYFQDDNGTQDRPWFKDLCRAIAAMKLKGLTLEFYRGIRVENLLDEELLALMKQAGFLVATVAPESGSERVRSLMRKNMARENIIKAVQLIRKAGLSPQGYFIIGYPGETKEERQETYRFAHELNLEVFSLHKYMALPGTGTFLRLVRDGKIPRDHTDEAHLIGDGLPNYNGDAPEVLDREIFSEYAKFYARKPWRFIQLFHMASAGGLWRSIFGTFKGAVRAVLGRTEPPLPEAAPVSAIPQLPSASGG